MARASGSYPEGRWFDSTRRYQSGRLAQLGEHLPYKQGVTGSSPVAPTKNNRGPVVQLVRMPACHAGGRRFEPVPDRQFLWRHSQVVRQRSAKPLFPGSNPGVASIPYGRLHLEQLNDVVGIVKWLRQRVVAPLCVGSNPTIHPIFLGKFNSVGVSPSGKATDSDSVMRRFESCYPSQKEIPVK